MPVRVACLVLLLSVVGALNVGDSCQTLYFRNGSCTPLNNCPAILLTVQRKRKTSSMVNYLKRSYCGSYVGDMPVVCCPAGKADPPLNKHPNRRFVNRESCGYSVSDRIWNGDAPGPSEYPWLALLLYIENDTYVETCGGSLISERFVLTAASCVGTKPDLVRLGEHVLRKDPDCIQFFNQMDCSDSVQDIEVKNVVIHPRHDATSGNKKHDIAMVELKNSPKFNGYVYTICLPIDNSDLDGIYRTLAGWCITDGKAKSLTLKQASVRIMRTAECAQAFHKAGVDVRNVEQLICAGSQRFADTCNADTGGPLMGFPPQSPKMTQYGVVTYVPGRCSQPNLPGVYTSVSVNLRWILENVTPTSKSIDGMSSQ